MLVMKSKMISKTRHIHMLEKILGYLIFVENTPKKSMWIVLNVEYKGDQMFNDRGYPKFRSLLADETYRVDSVCSGMINM